MAVVAFVLGWFASTIVPVVLERLHIIRHKVFPPKPTPEEMVALILKKLKEQEGGNHVQ